MKLQNIPLNLTMLSLVGRKVTCFGPTAFKVGSSGSANVTQRNLFNRLFGSSSSQYPIMADESVMSPKSHGTSESPVQKNLRWNCDNDTADRICNFNRHYAEHAGYWESTSFLKTVKDEDLPIKFHDSVTGALLFQAPVGRSIEDFVKESKSHGW